MNHENFSHGADWSLHWNTWAPAADLWQVMIAGDAFHNETGCSSCSSMVDETQLARLPECPGTVLFVGAGSVRSALMSENRCG